MQDLLRPENENLQIRESDTGVFVAGVHETEVKGMEDCLHLLQLGERNRYTDRLFKRVPLQSACIYPQCLQRHTSMPKTDRISCMRTGVHGSTVPAFALYSSVLLDLVVVVG